VPFGPESDEKCSLSAPVGPPKMDTFKSVHLEVPTLALKTGPGGTWLRRWEPKGALCVPFAPKSDEKSFAAWVSSRCWAFSPHTAVIHAWKSRPACGSSHLLSTRCALRLSLFSPSPRAPQLAPASHRFFFAHPARRYRIVPRTSSQPHRCLAALPGLPPGCPAK